jgi:DNA ligase (NAD+)
LGKDDFYLVCQPNCDGFAVSLTYKHGLLAKVEPISGDLTVQSNTDIARKVSSISKRLIGTEPPAQLEVVGHLYVPMPDGVSKPAGGLSALKLFVNGISSSTGGRVPAKQWAALAYMEAAGFNVSSEIKLVRTPGELLAYYDTLAQNPSVRDFPCKGMTVKVNRFDRQSLLSESADGASWALFYGFPAKANAAVATPKEAQGWLASSYPKGSHLEASTLP